MPYNFAADSFHTKKLCSRLSSSEVRFYTEICRFVFLRPPLGDLGATYDDHLRLIGKRVPKRRLPISVNWIFFARCYSWGATSNYWFNIGDFAQTGAGWPKISGTRGRPPHQLFLSQKTRRNAFFVWYINLDRSFYHFVTIHACDGQTDGQTEFSSLDRVCIPCSAVKKSFASDTVDTVDCAVNDVQSLHS